MTFDPARPALIAGRQVWSYREIEERIGRCAGRLAALGIGRGDAVGILAPNSADWAVVAHAVPRLGAVLVPLSVRRTTDEIAAQARCADLRLLLGDEAAAPSIPAGIRLTFGELENTRPAAEAFPASLDPDRPSMILFTSGTTSNPKGVVLTWANQTASARASSSVLGLSAEDRWLACLPFFHVGGLNILYRCASVGASVVLQEGFSAAAVNEAFDRDRVTVASFVASMLARTLAERGDRPLPESLRAILVGGGPVPATLVEASPRVLKTYGMTETCSHVTLVRPGADREERGSAGRPLPGVEVRISDREGSAQPPGAVGTIEVRGPVVMQGYLGEARSGEGRIRDGWFRTEDLGRFDRAGCLHVVGRTDDRIVSGGEKIDPGEIEAALLADPRVLEAVVVGIPDPEWGETPLALIVPWDRSISAERIWTDLRMRLARHRMPRIEITERIPRLPNGKPDRIAIRARYAEGSDGSPSTGR